MLTIELYSKCKIVYNNSLYDLKIHGIKQIISIVKLLKTGYKTINSYII